MLYGLNFGVKIKYLVKYAYECNLNLGTLLFHAHSYKKLES
jgi:hypothetical protein